VSLGKYLSLHFVSGDEAGYKTDVELLKLVQGRDASVRLRFGKLAGPPGITEANVEVRRER
jgi:hypothetical protein